MIGCLVGRGGNRAASNLIDYQCVFALREGRGNLCIAADGDRRCDVEAGKVPAGSSRCAKGYHVTVVIGCLGRIGGNCAVSNLIDCQCVFALREGGGNCCIAAYGDRRCDVEAGKVPAGSSRCAKGYHVTVVIGCLGRIGGNCAVSNLIDCQCVFALRNCVPSSFYLYYNAGTGYCISYIVS